MYKTPSLSCLSWPVSGLTSRNRHHIHDSVHGVLVNKKSSAMLVFILFSTGENLVSFVRCCFAKFFHLISHSPRMFHLYLSISCVSSWSFPAAPGILVFQVPMVMLFLPRIFDDAPVAYLTITSWCTAEGAVLVDSGGDRSGMVWNGMVAYFHHMVSHGQSTT